MASGPTLQAHDLGPQKFLESVGKTFGVLLGWGGLSLSEFAPALTMVLGRTPNFGPRQGLANSWSELLTEFFTVPNVLGP